MYIFSCTSCLTFCEGSLWIVKPILVSVNACAQYISIGVSTHLHLTHTEKSSPNTGNTRKNRILHRALWKGFSRSLQGAAWRPLICRFTWYFVFMRSTQLNNLHPKFRMPLLYLMVRVKQQQVTNRVFEPQIVHVWKGAYMDNPCKNKDSCDWIDTFPT